MALKKKSAPAKQTRNPARTRMRLLQAATRLFSRKGYDGVSVDDIVGLARVNKRMVYHYYGSKDGLYGEVLRSVFQQLTDMEMQVAAASDSPVETITGILRSYFAFLNDHPEFASLLAWENLHQGRFIAKHPDLLSKNPVLQQLERTVRKGVSDGLFHPGIHVKHLLINLISVCIVYHANRYTLSQSIGIDLQSPKVQEEGLEHAIDLVLHGLKRR
jgi:AcrR family transcriptional regulator